MPEGEIKKILHIKLLWHFQKFLFVIDILNFPEKKEITNKGIKIRITDFLTGCKKTIELYFQRLERKELEQKIIYSQTVSQIWKHNKIIVRHVRPQKLLKATENSWDKYLYKKRGKSKRCCKKYTKYRWQNTLLKFIIFKERGRGAALRPKEKGEAG